MHVVKASVFFVSHCVCVCVCSTLRASVVREHTKSVLRKQGTASGDFIITEFEDPILKEHVISISVSDIPRDLQVSEIMLFSD